jgi:2-polyprenyl-3-methyl-5-hydroxy-6-metoxy-1,4-benzoquinol methylase
MQSPGPKQPRVAIFVIAYDAVNTLARTIERIPAEVLDHIEEIFVIDDCSTDNTYYAALGFKQARGLDKLKVFRNAVSLRYGGNQKRGYQYAIDRGFDVVVLLHADGQYAPEVLPQLLEPLLNDEADMVIGSRLAEGGKPVAGGMPVYKYLGIRVLSWLQNRLVGLRLSEWHSGYRLYRCAALARLPFALDSDDWHFDTELLVQFKEAGLRIAERPIPTYAGDELRSVSGLAYAFNCLLAVVRYRLHKAGWIDVGAFQVGGPLPPHYQHKPVPHSSHSVMMGQLERLRPHSVLELGTATGFLTRQMRDLGCEVTGVELDASAAAEAAPFCTRMLVGDLEDLSDAEIGGPYDAIVCGDVLEHLRDPWTTLERLVGRLAPGGHVIVSLPNIANWVCRWQLLRGTFEYMALGPMDRTHLRFFTRKTALALVRGAGLEIQDCMPTPLPLPSLSALFSPGRSLAWMHRFNATVTRLRPTLLGYQFVVVGRKSTTPAVLPPGTNELRGGSLEPASRTVLPSLTGE